MGELFGGGGQSKGMLPPSKIIAGRGPGPLGLPLSTPMAFTNTGYPGTTDATDNNKRI